MLRSKAIAMAALALLALGPCGTKKTEAAKPGVRITKPADNTTVKGNTVSLDLAPVGVSIVKADGDTTGKSGHFHIFIDRDPVPAGQVIPKEPGIVHSAADPTLLTGLSPGSHTISVVLGDGVHTRIGNSVSTIKVTVEGPSVDASAPAKVAAGQAVSLKVTVTGVTLVKTDGAAAGTTGHLHVLVDREPVPGQPIPKEAGIIHTIETTISVPGLTAGDHTIWVVLGDGTHVPYDPAVLDKVTVTVA